MHYQAIDTLLVASADLEATQAIYHRLGVPMADDDAWAKGRSFQVGGVRTLFAAATPFKECQGLVAVGLAVSNLPAVLKSLACIDAQVEGKRAWLPLHDQAGCNLVLHEPMPGAPAADSPFALRRLDHLAAVTHDLEAKTRFWVEVLGVPLVGEVRTPTLVIRQFRIGDAIMELLGAASADSPIHQRPAGLVSMASWEVADLDAAVRQARAAGFTPSTPAPGALPRTRIATIQAAELAGLTMQLLKKDEG